MIFKEESKRKEKNESEKNAVLKAASPAAEPVRKETPDNRFRLICAKGAHYRKDCCRKRSFAGGFDGLNHRLL